MESIWNNTFYNTPPALAWTFIVDFSNLIKFDISSNDIKNDWISRLNTLSKAVVSINAGKREAEAVDLNYGGMSFKVITRDNNTGTLDITFNEDTKYTITEILQLLYNLFARHQYYPKSDGTENDYKYNGQQDLLRADNRSIVIRAYNSGNLNIKDEKNIVKEFIFVGCQLQGIDEFEFSYESTDTITRSASFLYDYMYVRNYQKPKEEK